MQAPLSERPTGVRYRVLAWACSLSMLTYIDRICIKNVEGPISRDLGLSVAEFAWVYSAFALSYAIFDLPSGWLGDRFGPRRMLSRIVIAWSLFTALTGLVGLVTFSAPPAVRENLTVLLVVRFLFGAGEAGAYPNIARALRGWFPYAQRGQAQGLLWMSGRWGGAAASWVIFFLAMPLGWRGAFVQLGAIGVVWVLAFRASFRDRPAEHAGVNASERRLIEAGTPERGARPALSWRRMLGSPTLWLLGAMYFCSNAGWSFFLSHDVKYYEQVLGLDEAEVRFASGVPLFCGGIACLLGGLVTDRQVRRWGPRWGRTLQGVLAYGLGGLLFLLAMGIETPWLAVACLCLASFVKDFAMAVSWATCLDIGERYAGTVSGFMNTVGNLGTVAAPPLVAWLAGHGEWRWALAFSATMFLAAALFWLFVEPRRIIVYANPEVEKENHPQGEAGG